VPPQTGPCLPAGAPITAETINRIDGSFSTNYMRFGGNYSRHWLEAGGDQPARREARLRAEYEFHPRAWVDEDMIDLYGRHRFHFAGAYSLRNISGRTKRLEGTAAAVWNPKVVETVSEWSGLVQVSCFPWTNGGWGFFVRVYAGQDYYNVGFLDELRRVHVGVTFNQGDFFRFRSRAP
jgi:hypothetical protein